MKKLKFVCLSLVTLFLVVLGIVFGGIEVSAYTYNPNWPGDDFTPYINQIVYCDLSEQDGQFGADGGYEVYLFIDELNSTFQFHKDNDFHPLIPSTIYDDRDWSYEGFMNLFGVGELYWNPWEQYWQFNYPYHEYFDIWDAPLSAKEYTDLDGKGIRLYIQALYGDSVTGELDFAVMRPVKNYYFGGYEQLLKGNAYQFGRNFFDSDLLDDWVHDALQFWGSGTTISEWDRVYVVYDVEMQRFVLEWHGINYWEFWITRYYGLSFAYEGLQYELETAFDNGFTEGFVDGYYVGYNEGVQTGAPEAYEQGFKDGQESKLAQNNEAFYQGIEKWLVPAIITVIALGGFVTIAARKRREE